MAITFPTSPSVNDTHTVNGRTWVWDGSAWKLSGTINNGISLEVSDTAPSTPIEGDMWYNSANGSTYTYYQSVWVELGNTAAVEAFISDADGDTLVHVEEGTDDDTIRFDTAGVERLTISSSGHVLPSADVTYDLGSATNRFRDLYLSGSSIDLGGVTISSDGTNLALPPISNISGDLTVDTDTLYVDSTNNRVGIGTTTPGKQLDIQGSGTVEARLLSTDGGDTALLFGDNTDTIRASVKYDTSEDRLELRGYNNAERLVIDSSGNVGIGTTTPADKLHVEFTSGTAAGIVLTNSGGTVGKQGMRIGFDNDRMTIQRASDSGAWEANYVSIDQDSGNVGIGRTNPDHKLHVDAGASGGVRIETDNDSVINFRTRNNARAWNVGNYYTTWNGLASPFIIQPTENSGTSDISITPVTNSPGSGLIIKADGRVVVGGETNPSAHFTVKAAGTGNNDGLVEFHSWTGSASSPTEVEDWPSPVLALRAYDNFYVQNMLSFGYPQDAIYQTGSAAWTFRLRAGNNQTVSTSSTNLEIIGPGTFEINCSLSKPSGSFKIPHPLPELSETHDLVHSFVESPKADNLYRGRATLVDGVATVNLDESAGMTEGTFVLLNRDIQCFISNDVGWTALRGSVDGNVLTIEAQDSSCVDTVSWLVVGERHDQHMYDTNWTDDEGRVIVEPVTNRVSEADIAVSVARMEAAKAAQSAP